MLNTNQAFSSSLSAAVPDQSEHRRQTRASCSRCGRRIESEKNFCTHCGARQSDFAGIVAWRKAKATVWRRIAGELLDCLTLLVLGLAVSTLIAFLDLRYRFWTVGVVVFLWDVFRDSSPNRRSLGKYLCSLRVVMDREQARYSWLRAAARRIVPASFKLAYLLAMLWTAAKAFHWSNLLDVIREPWLRFAESRFFEATLALIPLAYFGVSVALMKYRGDGKRIEDFLLGMRVIRESAYEQVWKKCVACEQTISKSAVYCPICGTRNSPSRIPVD